jgi:adenylate cyclase
MASRTSEHPHTDLLIQLHLLGGAGVVAFIVFFLYWGNLIATISESVFLVTLVATVLWLRFRRTGTTTIAAFHIGMLLANIAVLSWSMGGLVDSGSIMVWGIVSPLAAMMFLGRREVLVSSGAFLLLLCSSWLVESSGPYIVRPAASIVAPLTAMNLMGGSLLSLTILYYFHQKLHAEQRRADNLLLNMLPEKIAETLKRQPGTIAEHHEGASILFADIADFTPMCRRLSATRVVELLNEVFSRFDVLAEHYGVEKIKTIGDCYMVAAGVPQSDPRHAELLTALALEMVHAARNTAVEGAPLQVRVGISSGPVVAGVIGQRKFIYDLWGDAVNLASRMESHGVRGQVRVTRSTYELIRGSFTCQSLGLQSIKGVGEVEVWQVLAWKDGVEPFPALQDRARRAG